MNDGLTLLAPVVRPAALFGASIVNDRDRHANWRWMEAADHQSALADTPVHQRQSKQPHLPTADVTQGWPAPWPSELKIGGTTGTLGARTAILGVLADAATLGAYGGGPVLRPLWATETMQRAYVMVRLVGALERKIPSKDCHPLALASELKLAQDLASSLRSVGITGDKTLTPCSQTLRTVGRNLVELFGPTVGRIQLQSSIEPIILPAFKRRALTMAASELVTNALRHAFGARQDGQITMSLCRVTPTTARFRVSDDGIGMKANHRPLSGIASDLASLLESDLVCYSAEGMGTLAEMTFPIRC